MHFRYSRTYSNLFKTNLQKDYKPLVIASDSLLVQLEKTVLIQPKHLKKLIMVTVIILIIQWTIWAVAKVKNRFEEQYFQNKAIKKDKLRISISWSIETTTHKWTYFMIHQVFNHHLTYKIHQVSSHSKTVLDT